jgi:hypothetical protein
MTDLPRELRYVTGQGQQTRGRQHLIEALLHGRQKHDRLVPRLGHVLFFGRSFRQETVIDHLPGGYCNRKRQ